MAGDIDDADLGRRWARTRDSEKSASDENAKSRGRMSNGGRFGIDENAKSLGYLERRDGQMPGMLGSNENATSKAGKQAQWQADSWKARK